LKVVFPLNFSELMYDLEAPESTIIGTFWPSTSMFTPQWPPRL